MKFVVEAISKQSGRIGNLTKADVSFTTPMVIHYTRAGSIPHISREVFDIFIKTAQMLQVSIETTYNMTEAVKSMQKGIGFFAGMDSSLIFATLRDTGATNQIFYSRDTVAIQTRHGKVTLTPKTYMETIEAFKPDIFHTLCDGDTDQESGNKRNTNAINRTETFFKECVQQYKSMSSLADSLLIVPIEGGYSLYHRQETIKSLNNYDDQDVIGGYFIDGFHGNGQSAQNVNASAVCDIVKKCNELLPTNKLRVMFGAYSPKLILQLIQLNIDLFDTTYAYLFASENRALTFNFHLNDDNRPSDEMEFQIDLSDTKYKDDFGPFVKNCTCYSCKNHTRAYTQHLIITKELLGPILLMIHNTHHYMEYFKVIRQCIADDTLPMLINLIDEQQSKYDIIKAQSDQKQKDDENVSSITDKSDAKQFKKLKNA